MPQMISPAFQFSSRLHSTALDTPFLSLILPAHNEEQRLPPSLEKIRGFLAKQVYPAEVIVVENGSHDRTLEVAREYQSTMPYLRVVQEELRGKGRAVRRGMLEASGEYRFICDVDFSMPVEEVNKFIPPILPDLDIAIASREAPGAVRYGEPAYRHLVGRVFNTMVRLTVLPGLQDTQCGFKCFRGKVADEIFPLQTLMGWSFDVEVLAIARRRGYRITEIPIPWYFDPGSRVRLFKDSYRMAVDLLEIRRRVRSGVYDRTA
ncbi:MAG TPA: dolichyl-phosphate beta-glucosyltransferase [Anaerolineaceae bacterium]